MRVTRRLKPSDASQMIAQSGLVTSSQTGAHPHLNQYVRRHLASPWLQPLHHPTVDVYAQLEREGVFVAHQPIILDSGCGTGKSTRRLADLFPGHIVIGVDRSQARLAKSGLTGSFYREGNCILLRAELPTFWRLLVNDGRIIERHFLFYPNPCPKARHLVRRWHGHPVFPQLLILGGEIELRCNWEIYALEFAQAVSLATGIGVTMNKIQPEQAVSPFEEKYMERKQLLFSVHVPAKNTEGFRLPQQAGKIPA